MAPPKAFAEHEAKTEFAIATLELSNISTAPPKEDALQRAKEQPSIRTLVAFLTEIAPPFLPAMREKETFLMEMKPTCSNKMAPPSSLEEPKSRSLKLFILMLDDEEARSLRRLVSPDAARVMFSIPEAIKNRCCCSFALARTVAPRPSRDTRTTLFVKAKDITSGPAESCICVTFPKSTLQLAFLSTMLHGIMLKQYSSASRSVQFATTIPGDRKWFGEHGFAKLALIFSSFAAPTTTTQVP